MDAGYEMGGWPICRHSPSIWPPLSAQDLLGSSRCCRVDIEAGGSQVCDPLPGRLPGDKEAKLARMHQGGGEASGPAGAARFSGGSGEAGRSSHSLRVPGF